MVCVIVITPLIEENYGQGNNRTNQRKEAKRKRGKTCKKSTNVVVKVGISQQKI
jgi:hypothetical protein